MRGRRWDSIGLLDEPRFEPYASRAFEAISSAEQEAGIRLTPFAREIVAHFIVAPVVEAPNPETLEPEELGISISTQLNDYLVKLGHDVRDLYRIAERPGDRRGLVTTADVYHWLTEQAQAEFAWLPYPKD